MIAFRKKYLKIQNQNLLVKFLEIFLKISRIKQD